MKQDTEKDKYLKRIIELEWNMFDQVNNIGGRAECQDNERMFYGMRYSYFSAFSMETLEQYLHDLETADKEGRNMLAEKYAYMMEYTDREYFKRELEDRLLAISPEKHELIQRISRRFVDDEMDFSKKYPLFSGAGRPVTGVGEGAVSSEVYLIGELKTYSVETLKRLWQDAIDRDLSQEYTLVRQIHENTANFYGYSSVEEAEAHLINH